MDDDRFDTLAKFIVSTTTRRKSLTALFGGGVAVLSLASPDATWSAKTGNCKETCGTCEACRTGKCKRKNGKKRCKPGTCGLLPGLSECAVGEVRNPVTCGCCQVNGLSCSPGGSNRCCSGACTDFGGVFFCLGFIEGKSCQFGAQCRSGVCNSDGRCA